MTFAKHSAQKEHWKGRIMVVDDDAGAAKVVSWILSRNHYSVRFFGEPKQALNEFKRNPDRYRAIVVDAHMPGMTGFEFARRIRKLRANIRIILLTDFQIGKSEFKKVFPSSQIDDILVKPTEPEELLRAVAGASKPGDDDASRGTLHRYQRAH